MYFLPGIQGKTQKKCKISVSRKAADRCIWFRNVCAPKKQHINEYLTLSVIIFNRHWKRKLLIKKCENVLFIY